MAAFAVARWIREKAFPQELLPEAGADRAFVQDVVYTTIRRFRPLRAVLGQLVKTWPKGELEALLLVGGAQILYMDDVPDFAAVNETVDAAKACPNKSIAKVVNGVLRNLIRRRGEFAAYLANAPLAERESFPNALVRRWEARYGGDGAAALCAWHNEPAETFLAYPPTAEAPEGRFEKLARGRRVTEVPGYGAGAFIVQDPATAGAVALCGAKPGLTVLDFCAAPGGKTIQLAWRGAEVTAQEVNPRRRETLAESLRRCGLAEKVRVTQAVAPEATFACVLADAPCTNTGVLRRRPDARWRWTEAHLREVVALQAQILDRAAAHCAPGGTLVYSTCSNEPEENEEQVAAFLTRHPDFEETARRVSVPTQTGCDGAFACAMRRRAAEGAAS